MSNDAVWIYGELNGEHRRLYYFEDYADKLGWKDNGHHYHRISCSYAFGDWIETQKQDWWSSYGGRHRAIYIVREELMTFIKLKWQ